MWFSTLLLVQDTRDPLIQTNWDQTYFRLETENLVSPKQPVTKIIGTKPILDY